MKLAALPCKLHKKALGRIKLRNFLIPSVLTMHTVTLGDTPWVVPGASRQGVSSWLDLLTTG